MSRIVRAHTGGGRRRAFPIGGVPRARRSWPALLLALGACAGVTTEQLGYAPVDGVAPRRSAAQLVVEPFGDARPARPPAPRLDPAWLLIAPLLPSVSRTWERLDESRAAEQLVRDDVLPLPERLFEVQLARAVAADLAASGHFADVRFAAAPPPDAALVLGGTIVSTRLTTTATAYGLGPPGLLLWLAALPTGRTTVEVAIDLALRDRSGAVRWRHPLRATVSRIVTLYGTSGRRAHALSTGSGAVSIPRYGPNANGIDPDSLWALHSEALRTAMPAVRQALAAELDMLTGRSADDTG